MPSSLNTLNLIKALAALDFRPMSENDFAAFADADADAVIAFADEQFTHRVCDAFGDALMTEEGCNMAVIVSGDHVELVGMKPDGDAVSYAFDLTRL